MDIRINYDSSIENKPILNTFILTKIFTSNK